MYYQLLSVLGVVAVIILLVIVAVIVDFVKKHVKLPDRNAKPVNTGKVRMLLAMHGEKQPPLNGHLSGSEEPVEELSLDDLVPESAVSESYKKILEDEDTLVMDHVPIRRHATCNFRVQRSPYHRVHRIPMPKQFRS